MADYQIVTEEHGGRALRVVKFAGQAETTTISRLMADIAALAASEAPLLVLLDESDLRAGLVLHQDLRGIIENWRATIARRSVRIGVYAPNPLIYGLNRMAEWIASRDAEGRLAVFSGRDDAIAWLLKGTT